MRSLFLPVLPVVLRPGHRMNTPADALARLIRDGFEDYHARFAAISRRARLRFEQRDWAGARQDAVERIGLYDQCIAEQCSPVTLDVVELIDCVPCEEPQGEQEEPCDDEPYDSDIEEPCE